MTPMTEARLSEIEAALKQVRENISKEDDPIALAMYKATTEPMLEGFDEFIAEVHRLRECIAKAPHSHSCQIGVKFYNMREEAWGEKECTCWQRQALGGE